MASMTVRNMTLRRLSNLSSVAHRSLHQQLGASSYSLASTLAAANNTNNIHATRRSFASSSSSDYVLSEREQEYYAKGWVDERGLTLFKTLHENQVRSCEIFADNDLYGNYSEETKAFEYKKYSDFAVQVNQARTVLQDLGEFNYLINCVFVFLLFCYN